MVDEERTVVVIEDDSDIRELIAHSLRMKGLSVATASTGREGLELVRSLSPDLVTLDLGLPDMDGVEVCRRLREFSTAYVVMITARADEIDRLMGLETGADDYLTKPFSPRELQARVNAMFRRPRAVPPVAGSPEVGVPPAADASPILSHGTLEIDVEGRGVSVDGLDVSLTRTEFDLLATLMSAPKRVWTREVLLRSVWGDDWSMDQHLVEVHVGNLRRKLGGAGSGSRFIRTVRGVGYRMELPEGS